MQHLKQTTYNMTCHSLRVENASPSQSRIHTQQQLQPATYKQQICACLLWPAATTTTHKTAGRGILLLYQHDNHSTQHSLLQC